MKKVLIALLSVLLVLSFTSCDRDKSEDVIAAYEEFTSFYRICDFADSMLRDVKNMEAGNTVNKSYLKIILDEIKGSDLTIESTKIKSGAKSIEENDENGSDATYTDVVIEYTYTEGSDTNVKTDIITINGTNVRKYPSTSRASYKYCDYSYNFTINGKSYEVSYFMSEGKYTSASVNKKSVDVRLLNSKKSNLG